VRDNRTYTQNFVRDLLGLSLPLLKVRATSVQLGGVDFFIERGLDTEELFVCRELIPATIGSARAEGYIIAVRPKGYTRRRARSIRSPSGQLPFPSKTGLIADIGIGLEG